MEIVKTIQHFRDLYRSYEFWIFVYDQAGETAIRRMKNRFYANAGADDFVVCSLPPYPFPLTIAAARKKRMLGRDLRRHLSRYVLPEFLTHDWSRDVLVVTKNLPTENVAMVIAAAVLELGDLSVLQQIEQEKAA